MNFDDIIGQKGVTARIIDEIDSGRLPHALLLCGPEGNGGFAIALAIADRLLGTGANSRAMLEKLQHPDLHFSFPVYRKESGKPCPCDKYITQFRTLALADPYFGYVEWMNAIDADKEQLVIYVDESDSLIKKLSLKSSQGGYKVSIIWLPEKMNAECANKMLKLLEEPPGGTVFLLVSEHPELLLPTIRSRTQAISVPRMSNDDIYDVLTSRYGINHADALVISRSSYGNLTAALRSINAGSEQEEFFNLFVELMRLAYVRKVKEMKHWSDTVAAMGRECQKRFLAYSQRMVRENFIHNFRISDIVHMDDREQQFAVKFAPYINERNVIGIMNELSLAARDIAQNANGKIVFFDFALKMIVLIKNR